MKKLLLILPLFLAASIVSEGQESRYRYLDPDMFRMNYRTEVFAVMIDARKQKEYRKGRIPGSVNLPRMKKLIPFADTLDREIPVYIYCDGEARSRTVASYLGSEGFINLIILKGGFRIWESYGLPVEKNKAPKH